MEKLANCAKLPLCYKMELTDNSPKLNYNHTILVLREYRPAAFAGFHTRENIVLSLGL